MTAAPRTLEESAAKAPQEIGVVEGERALDYASWNAQANRIANGLKTRGLGRGDVVGVRMPNRLEWALVSAALGKIGASLLGLNWRLTPDEVRGILLNSGATALLCDDTDPAPLAAALADVPLKLTCGIEGTAPGFVPFSALLEGADTPLFSAGDPPLIIYTSGTTGAPKGVVMDKLTSKQDQDLLVEYLRDVAAIMRPAAPGAVVLVTMPLHAAATPSQLWSAMRARRTVVLMRRFDAEGVLDLIQRHRVTHWNCVPTMLKRIAGLPEEVQRKYDVSSIRLIGIGAAPVPATVKAWVFEYFGPDCLSEGYGATETGMIARMPPQMQRAKPGSCGLLHKHVKVQIRDESGAVLPPNHEGEIWVRTPMTISRYLNGKAFDNSTLDGEGYFRIGDIGKFDDDGFLFITDRAKDMIISGGVNIYPAEIEAALIEHPAVQDAAVIGVPDDEFGEQVKAFCELRPGVSATPAELEVHCRARLASYKCPKSIEIVGELPRNTMGKVLKRELRAPYWKDREQRI